MKKLSIIFAAAIALTSIVSQAATLTWDGGAPAGYLDSVVALEGGYAFNPVDFTIQLLNVGDDSLVSTGTALGEFFTGAENQVVWTGTGGSPAATVNDGDIVYVSVLWSNPLGTDYTSVSTGSFTVPTGGSGNYTWSGTGASNFGGTTNTALDMGAWQPVPEPGTIALALAGLFAFVAKRRRNKK